MGEDAAAGNGGHGPRAVVESEIIHVIGVITRAPNGLTVDGVEAIDDFLIVDSVKQDELAVGYRGTGKAGADSGLPELLWTGSRPGGQGFSLIGSIAAWAEKLRLILGA